MTLVRRILQEKRHLVLPLAVALAANVAIFAVAVLPLARKVDAATARAGEAAGALAQAEAAHKAALAVVAGKARADEELKKFYREVLPADWATARRITYLRLVQLANKFGLSPTQGAAEPRSDDDSALTRLQMTMKIAGEYRGIRQFLYALETAPDFVVIENVSLAQGQESNAPLVLTLEVATYYWAGEHGQ
jgi:Tfp pilus assembly protein PilO